MIFGDAFRHLLIITLAWKLPLNYSLNYKIEAKRRSLRGVGEASDR
ncbi:hypothetical protein [Coleofasciculus sp. FACHB-SPT36]|nr:hypothetical protein [Coleofasciculus sp. FACHB-SPT36]